MLKNFVSVYVPGTSGLNGELSPAKQAAYIQETARRLSAAFGGSTATPATGYYVSDSGLLVEERVVIVKSYHDKNQDTALNIARSVAAWIKTELNQESVSVETESGLDFI